MALGKEKSAAGTGPPLRQKDVGSTLYETTFKGNATAQARSGAQVGRKPWHERILAPLYWLASKLLRARIESQGILEGDDARFARLLMAYSRTVLASEGGPDGPEAQAFRREHARELEELAGEPPHAELEAIDRLWHARQAAQRPMAAAAADVF